MNHRFFLHIHSIRSSITNTYASTEICLRNLDRPAQFGVMIIQNSITPSATPVLLTRKQVAEMLSVHVRTVDGWIASGRLPSKKISRKCIRFRASDIAAFVAAE